MGKITETRKWLAVLSDPLEYGTRKKKRKTPECKETNYLCKGKSTGACISKTKSCKAELPVERKPKLKAIAKRLREQGSKPFTGYIGGKKNGVRLDNLTAEHLEIAAKYGVSQRQLMASRVPESVQSALLRSLKTAGVQVEQATPYEKPTPRPRPTRKPEPIAPQLTVDDIPQNAFTKKWRGAWDEADIPQDLLRVLSKVEPPGEKADRGRTAYYNVRTGDIFMASAKAGEGRGNNTYRHEYGHHLDFSLRDFARKRQETKPIDPELRESVLADVLGSKAKKVRDFANLTPEKRVEAWDRGIDNIVKKLEEDYDKIIKADTQYRTRFPGYVRVSPEVDAKEAVDALRASLMAGSVKDDLLFSTSPARSAIKKMFSREGLPMLSRADVEEIDERVDRQLSRMPGGSEYKSKAVHASDTWSSLLREESKEILEERRKAQKAGQHRQWFQDEFTKAVDAEVSVIKQKYGGRWEKLEKNKAQERLERKTRSAKGVILSDMREKLEASSSPGLKAIAKVLVFSGMESKILPQIVTPSGVVAPRADVLNALAPLQFRPELDHVFDLVGATTKNKAGWGHSTSYYDEANKEYGSPTGAQSGEVFANLTDMHAFNDNSRAIAEYFVPKQYAEYKKILAEYGASND